MTNQIRTAGGAPSKGQKQPIYAPIFIDKTFTGLFTQRSPLHDPSDLVTSRFYGGRPDTLWDGLNVELTNELTLARRPGLSAFSTATYPTPPLSFYAFVHSDNSIEVLVDTATVVYRDNQNGTKTTIFTKSAGAGPTRFITNDNIQNTCYMGNGVDTVKYTPNNINGIIWLWGIAAPLKQPGLTITESGVAAPAWQASTVWSTMGLIYDSTSDTIAQLNSVNVSGTNPTQFGTSGPGQPSAGWNATIFGHTTDNTVTWQNQGQVKSWTANTQFSSWFNAYGSLTMVIYDPITKAMYMNISIQNFSSFTGYFTGSAKPNFKAGVGQTTADNQCVWLYVGIPGVWKTGHAYALPSPSNPGFGAISAGAPAIPPTNLLTTSVTEPVSLEYGLPATQPVYWHSVSTAGTSGATGISPFGLGPAITAGYILQDNGDLAWLSLGSGTWAASTFYSGWTSPGSQFSALNDTNGNLQVCTTSGTSSTVKPQTTFALTAAANASAGDTNYTGTFSPVLPVGSSVIISGFSNAVNNGAFTVVTCSSTHLVVNNASGTAEGSGSYFALFNPWGVGYGTTTTDGTVIWTCVGTSLPWVASQTWNLPITGFSPPQTGTGTNVSSAAYGGSDLKDNNGNVEFTVNSGLGAATVPTWNPIGQYTAEGGTPLVLTSVAVVGGKTTYNGTITGGGSNAFAGKQFIIAGFVTHTSNNGLITVLASSGSTLVCATGAQVNETNPATATTGLIWYDLEALGVNSLSWVNGYTYAYSYKARTLADYYSPLPLGGGNTPPGLSTPLGAPTGSESGAISTASPFVTIVGSNPGAVNTLTGVGSTDLQVDTIVIWRSPDQLNGQGSMYELTEIPAPLPINGVAQPWSFQDYLPDTPTALYPGLNALIPAPINHQNDPPPVGFLPSAYHYNRIWGMLGTVVNFSLGPDQTNNGNPNESFNPVYEFPYLSAVTRLVHSANGLIVFTSSDIELIIGSTTTSFSSTIMVPGVGLLNFLALDTHGSIIYFFSADKQFNSMDPALQVSRAGFPIGDKLAGWDPTKVGVTVYEEGIDNCVIVSDSATGWYRLNPHQVPQGEAIWSPFAAITNGAGAVQAITTTPGTKNLLVGATSDGQEILKRDLTVWSDAGSAYDSYLVMGSLGLAYPGQMAELGFIESDFSHIGSTPTVGYLLNEISGTFINFSASEFDPPDLYGTTGVPPQTLYPLRFYFLQTTSQGNYPPPVYCRHLQIKVDFGSTDTVKNEMLNLTIFAAEDAAE